MRKGDTLKNNIKWLLDQYKKELQQEEQKDIDEQDLTIIECYQNIIIELDFALNVSK